MDHVKSRLSKINMRTCDVEAIVVTIDLIGHKKLLQLVDDALIQAIVSPGPIKSAVDFGAPPKCSSSRQMKCPPCLQITAMSLLGPSLIPRVGSINMQSKYIACLIYARRWLADEG